MAIWNSIAEWWQQVTGLDPVLLESLLSSAVVLAVYLGLRLLCLAFVYQRVSDVTRRYHIKKVIEYAFAILFILVIAKIWLRGNVSLGTFLGLAAAGIAIALQEPLSNMAGWLFILLRQPFRVGDRIQVGTGIAGDVIDVRLFMFSVLEIGNWVDADQSTGRIVHVPNNNVFRSTIANYTMGFEYVWHELPITVTFESDWKRAKEVIEKCAAESLEPVSADAERTIREAAQKFMIFYSTLTTITWVKVADHGVTLTLRYMCKVRSRRKVESELWVAILTAFAQEPSVDFAYPTQRLYWNKREGKPEAGGPPSVIP
ncbi:MAG: mechanosensitive ion channel family protein [Planctomycetes bacterium]|nr:mechanosensitive ion channel family protein [Planctomycetota bacterium]